MIDVNQAAGSPFSPRAIPAAAIESRWMAADGHAIRRIDWPNDGLQRPRGSLLFMPGRGDCYEKYLETLDYWHRQGWHVTAMDWRGQAGSGREGLDAYTGHIADFGIWTGDLAHFWTQWTREILGPHVLVGHSMGGHLVLRALAEQGVTPDALVLSAPMLGIPGWGLPSWALLLIARAFTRLGDPRRPSWKWGEKPGAVPADRIRLLTHDERRYADDLWWRAARPELAMGPGSWGWTVAALRSVCWLEAAGRLEQCQTPVLLLGTRTDGLVRWKAIARAAARSPRGQLVSWGKEARHELLREVDAVRDAALAAIDRFLAAAAPPPR